ncbi:MAG TPA: universal stress protein [Methanomassiliicoccaceae archaeon]|nr:universal stress protein [Methanomassiliicoccaceae archaeon]
MNDMGRYRRILLPVDGSESAKNAMRVGLEMAKMFDAEVTAVSVVDTASFSQASQGYMLPDMYAYADEAAEAIVEEVVKEGEAMDLKVKGVVSRGPPWQEIVDLSRDHDLVVMGTHGRSGVSHSIMGSVAEKVVRFAHCHVMVVK